MEFSDYKITRTLLDSVVNSLAKNSHLLIYGSFRTHAFHLPLSVDYSFSDVDLVSSKVVLTDKERTAVETFFCEQLFEKFGINFRVSIRSKRIHHDTLDHDVSRVVSWFETLLKIMDKPLNKEHSHYQLAKIYLRIVYRHPYFKSGVNFERDANYGNVLEKCCQIKTRGGYFNNQEITACIKEIENVFPDIGKDMQLVIDSGILIEDIYRIYSPVLIAKNAYELLDDIRKKMDLAKQANNKINWDIEKLHPAF